MKWQASRARDCPAAVSAWSNPSSVWRVFFFLIGCHGSVVYVFCRPVAAVFLLTRRRSWRSGAGKKFHAVKSYKNTWFLPLWDWSNPKVCKPGLLRKRRQFRFVAWCFLLDSSLCSGRIVDSCVLTLTIFRDVILFRALEGVVLFKQVCEVLEKLLHRSNVGLRSFLPLQPCLWAGQICKSIGVFFILLWFLLIKDTTWYNISKTTITHLWALENFQDLRMVSRRCGHSFVPATVVARKTIKKRPVTSKLSQQWAFGCLETCWNWQSKKRKNVWRIACRILTACCNACQNPAVFCISGCPQCLAGHSSCACSKRFRSLKWWFPCVSRRNSEPPFSTTCKVGSQ